MQIEIGKTPHGDIMVYEYGVRLDRDCVQFAGEQIAKARRLYNELVASIRGIVGDMQVFLVTEAGPEAAVLQQRIDVLGEAFAQAKAEVDEPTMKSIAQERRLLWRELGDKLKHARTTHRATLQERFFSRIGKKSSCDTYRIRCQAVADGLGWATANAVLDAALIAFQKSFKRGRAPRFADGSEKIQDSLSLQFTVAGGISVETVLSGTHNEIALVPPQECGPRQYGELRFRLGAAAANRYATGTWQYHRPLPAGASVSLARIVRRRIGKDDRWYVQLIVTLPDPLRVPVAARKPLAAVHFGWASDVNGRRIAGMADSADPGAARILQLPPAIEEALASAATIQGERDTARDQIVEWLKAQEPEGISEAAREEAMAIRRLPAQHVAVSRLHRLCRLLRDHGTVPDPLEAWRKDDRLRWQAAAHTARRARNARLDFYRNTALDLAKETLNKSATLSSNEDAHALSMK